MMEPILTLQFTPEQHDYVRASRILARKSSWFLIAAAVILVAILASAIILIFPGVGRVSWHPVARIVFVVGLTYFLYYLVLIPVQLRRAYRSNEFLRIERTLNIFDTHLEMILGEQSVQLPWEALQRVIDGGDYLLLVFAGEEKVYPFIPVRVFDDLSAKKKLFDFFKAKSIPVI
jgi:hypothetical protein